MPGLPTLLWEPAECHRRLMCALDDVFARVHQDDGFGDNWRRGCVIRGTKTAVRQCVMLGAGAAGRSDGGFQRFASQYIAAEGGAAASLYERVSYERYGDFVFYTADDWYAGQKVPLLAAECESNPTELLGELSGLLTTRAPLKYLFICGDNTLSRLDAFCRASSLVDWPGTTIYVVEIPDEPAPPSSWLSFVGRAKGSGAVPAFASAS